MGSCQNPRKTCSGPQAFTGHPGAGRGATVALEKRQEGASPGGRGFVWLVCKCGLCLNRRRRQWGEVGRGVSGYMQPPPQPLQIQAGRLLALEAPVPDLSPVKPSDCWERKYSFFSVLNTLVLATKCVGIPPQTNQFSSSLWVPDGCPTIHSDTSSLGCQIPQ